MTMSRVLVANRGEIARRVFATCHRTGLASVAVFSDADARSPHVSDADVAVRLPGHAPAETYLRGDRIVAAALAAGADAVHPGYGFLSENASFAKAVKDAGLIFIGPDPDIITKMGSKIGARQIAEAAGVPVVPGIKHPLKDADEALEIAKKIGFPLLLKAAAGGGGKGMRAVREEKDLKSAFTMAQNEAISSFKDDAVYIEKLCRHLQPQEQEEMRRLLKKLGKGIAANDL